MAKRTKAATKPRETVAAVWVPTEDLVPWIENPRHQSDAHTADVVKSIKATAEAAGTGNLEDGFGPAITARLANNEIIAGHTRLQAAHELCMERVPVRFLDIPEEAAHRLARADNRLTETGKWNVERLVEQLAADREKSIELIEQQGWTDKELDRLIDVYTDDPLDPMKEWAGMPYFKQGDETAREKILVSFKDEEGRRAFAKKLGVKITDKTRQIWYPPEENVSMTDHVWIDDEGDHGDEPTS